jgi:glycosyltransferase involved in cell wall biosynthesis
LAEAIKRLLQNPDERQRMGERGRERTEKEFNQENAKKDEEIVVGNG